MRFVNGNSHQNYPPLTTDSLWGLFMEILIRITHHSPQIAYEVRSWKFSLELPTTHHRKLMRFVHGNSHQNYPPLTTDSIRGLFMEILIRITHHSPQLAYEVCYPPLTTDSLWGLFMNGDMCMVGQPHKFYLWHDAVLLQLQNFVMSPVFSRANHKNHFVGHMSVCVSVCQMVTLFGRHTLAVVKLYYWGYCRQRVFLKHSSLRFMMSSVCMPVHP